MFQDSRLAPAALLAGPRGRRMLLQFACQAEVAGGPDHAGPLSMAVADASYRLAKRAGKSITRSTWGSPDGATDPLAAQPSHVAALLAATRFVTPTAELLRSCLAASVDAATYWEGPDGDDLLAAVPTVRDALRPVAELICASPESDWLGDRISEGNQVGLRWLEAPTTHRQPAGQALRSWRADLVAEEQRAARDRPADPTAPYSGTWWSTPPHGLPVTCAPLFDQTPSGLWFVEDTLGWSRADALPVDTPADAHVLEINGADDWAALCRARPLAVTASRRHDWYRATGWTGSLVIPDWAGLACDYDAVHLSYAGYLAAAGVAIRVIDGTASVIAGWNPGATYWLVDKAEAGEPTRWHRDDDTGEPRWTSQAPDEARAE